MNNNLIGERKRGRTGRERRTGKDKEEIKRLKGGEVGEGGIPDPVCSRGPVRLPITVCIAVSQAIKQDHAHQTSPHPLDTLITTLTLKRCWN